MTNGMDLGGAASVPVASFARIPHDAVAGTAWTLGMAL